MNKRIIITKTLCEEIASVIHIPLLKIEKLPFEKVLTDWVLLTSTNAVYDFGNSKIIAAPSCMKELEKIGKNINIVLSSMLSDDIEDLVKKITEKETLTYLSGDKTSLDINKISNNNFFRKIVYKTMINREISFKPQKDDIIVFWSGSAVNAAYELNWDLGICNIISCSKSASLALKHPYQKVENYELNLILAEINKFF